MKINKRHWVFKALAYIGTFAITYGMLWFVGALIILGVAIMLNVPEIKAHAFGFVIGYICSCVFVFVLLKAREVKQEIDNYFRG